MVWIVVGDLYVNTDQLTFVTAGTDYRDRPAVMLGFGGDESYTATPEQAAGLLAWLADNAVGRMARP